MTWNLVRKKHRCHWWKKVDHWSQIANLARKKYHFFFKNANRTPVSKSTPFFVKSGTRIRALFGSEWGGWAFTSLENHYFFNQRTSNYDQNVLYELTWYPPGGYRPIGDPWGGNRCGGCIFRDDTKQKATGEPRVSFKLSLKFSLNLGTQLPVFSDQKNHIGVENAKIWEIRENWRG